MHVCGSVKVPLTTNMFMSIPFFVCVLGEKRSVPTTTATLKTTTMLSVLIGTRFVQEHAIGKRGQRTCALTPFLLRTMKAYSANINWKDN